MIRRAWRWLLALVTRSDLDVETWPITSAPEPASLRREVAIGDLDEVRRVTIAGHRIICHRVRAYALAGGLPIWRVTCDTCRVVLARSALAVDREQLGAMHRRLANLGGLDEDAVGWDDEPTAEHR